MSEAEVAVFFGPIACGLLGYILGRDIHRFPKRPLFRRRVTGRIIRDDLA